MSRVPRLPQLPAGIPFSVATLALAVGGSACPTAEPEPEPSPEPPSFCEEHGFGREQPWNEEGPFGIRRNELAEDFDVEVLGDWEPEDEWDLSERWSGCESYLFVPDTLSSSSSDNSSIWLRDLDALVAESPRNAHYFFVSRKTGETSADQNLDEMVFRVEDLLDDLAGEDPSDDGVDDATWWAERLHVVADRASQIGGWVEDVVKDGIGTGGFAVDRMQRVRGIGSFADVTRYDPGIPNWPWASNLAYAAHEARFFNMEADRQDRLDAAAATVVPLWSGEVGGAFEADFALPDAGTLAAFDTMEIEVSMQCPNQDLPEPGNCGAWDYLAYLFVQDPSDETWIELGRFITTYHREAHWVLDVTPMLVHLLDGGTRHFRWDGGGQSTLTWLSLRFSNQGKGYYPRQIVPLFDGGMSGQSLSVPIPATAVRAELFAFLTGHGNNEFGCAEFCNHRHRITVGATPYLREHNSIGENEGCIAEIEDQMSPNQWGTWWFGRGGWCPGQLVEPWWEDVSADAPAGQDATFAYERLNLPFEDVNGGGNVLLNSMLVVYE
jgi:hypothetical protein